MNGNQPVDRAMTGRMQIALETIENCQEFALLIPEVRTNMVYARCGAQTPAEVLAIDGRITVVSGMPRAAGKPRFGASNHLARLIAMIMDSWPDIRVAIDFSNTPDLARWLEKYCKEMGWEFAIIDRQAEPEVSRDTEGSTMAWKAGEAVRAAGPHAPKIFCDAGAFGKEPISIIVGEDPVSVAGELCEIARQYAGERR